MSNRTLENQDVAVKSLGIIGSASVLIGAIVGSGIFMNVSTTLQASPTSVGLLVTYWIFGGIISMFGGLCYAELGCTFTTSGGERTYLAETYGVPFGVTFTYVYTFLIMSTSLAGLAIACGTYLTEMFLPNYRNAAIIQKCIGSCTLLIVMLINCASKHLATKISIIVTSTKLLALFMIIIMGIVKMAEGEALDLDKPFSYEKFDMSKFGNTLVNIFWTMDGWNILGALVGDMKNPKRDLPIVMAFSLLMITVIYCMTIISYIAVLGYNKVMFSQTVAISVAEKVIGKAGKIIAIFIACSTFGTINSNIYSVSKVPMVSGYNGEMPGIFSLVRRKERTPMVAIISLVMSAFIFLPFDFNDIVQYCGFITWLFYFIVLSIPVYVRFRRKDLKPTFRVFILLPIIVQAVALFMMFSILFVEKLYVGCGIMILITLFLIGIHMLPVRYRSCKLLNVYHEMTKEFLMKHLDLVSASALDIT